jgi:hypothetical protein
MRDVTVRLEEMKALRQKLAEDTEARRSSRKGGERRLTFLSSSHNRS